MEKKVFSSFSLDPHPLPNLLEIQTDSYRWFLEEGLKDLFTEVEPITDHSGKEYEITFGDYYFDEPKYSEEEARNRGASYEASMRVVTRLKHKESGEIKEQEVFLGDFPLMSSRGTFIINGVERVIVSQIIRSSGVFFTGETKRGTQYFGAKMIPNRGAWVELTMDRDNALQAKIDRKRKVPVTALLRIFGLETDEDIKKVFADLGLEDEIDQEDGVLANTLEKDDAEGADDAYIEVYKRIRPGDLATVDNAKSLIKTMFSRERYDLAKVGRWKMDQRLEEIGERLSGPIKGKLTKQDLNADEGERVLHLDDLVLIVAEIIRLFHDPDGQPDDIDHLGNRRVRAMGELFLQRLRLGLSRVERIARDRMTTTDPEKITPSQLINARPLIAIIKEFFSSGQLSQFMDQVNPLAELEHKRRLSALGPGGLARERAGFDVRDVHTSHYGRICPIQTPEGPNIGLVESFASYARLNELGFIETPYRVVENGKVTDKVEYLNALQEERNYITHAGVETDSNGKIKDEQVEVRHASSPTIVGRDKVDYMDVGPQQIISMSTALIPFLEHDDANRALMGSNMQRQAVPCVKPQVPLVGTGAEERAAQDSGYVLLAQEDGEVTQVDAQSITVKYKKEPEGLAHEKFMNSEDFGTSPTRKTKKKKKDKGVEITYPLQNFVRSNQYTALTQYPRIDEGQKVKKGDVLADGVSSVNGALGLGQNLLVAFMSWRGYNFEDAIIISEKLVREDVFSSIHIEDYSIDVRETKLGPEQTTCDIPNTPEDKLKDLDEEGIIRIGAEVGQGDILVGKITPKGESDLTAEERLLRAIFGEKARDIKDTSLKLPHGKKGRVVGVKIFSRENGDKLPAGVIKTVQVEVAEYRKISVGDKLAGRHGNKGVIARILPEEDMPYLEDGTPVDIILNPLGVASRMNIGQILETHLGWAAHELGYRAVTPALSGATEEQIKDELKKAGLPEDGKVELYDGYTGEALNEKVTVGMIYMLKLDHLVEDKLHMRSIGPYSLITQQPLGGKAQFGGQRFGEMEVWALEGYGAAHALQEMLTIKSDDVAGRGKAYESIIKGEDIKQPNIPASFFVLMNEMKGIGLNVELIDPQKDPDADD